MGIYSSGDIYGIRINLMINDDENVLFEIKMDTIMNNEKKREAKIFYNELSENDRTKVRFQIYTETSSTYHDGVFMMWNEITLDYFLQNFDM